MEEEEKTPEAAAALNGEGDMPDQDLEEKNECILEHAMSCGLLNDDDCEHFHEGIARIQSGSSSLGVNEIFLAQEEVKII